jgi:cell wall-associated NlpC family hydrolase
MKFLKYFPIIIIILSCKDSDTKLQPINLGNEVLISRSDTQSIVKNEPIAGITDTINILQEKQLNIPAVSRQELVRFAKTLMGTPYKYASTDPSIGLDCSGFITFVFNHFHWEVPRSSVDFTNFGKQINLKDAREGDLILFTGTNDSIRIVGHMGIVTENSDTLKFIHSTSGRAYGVTISNLEKRYKKRFVKVISIFPG